MSMISKVAEREAQQKKVFTNWINYKLMDRDDNMMVTKRCAWCSHL